ncbi:MAG: DUF4178 domain-containing protein [Fuerstiella sp.]
MKARVANCPSCGGPVEFHTKSSLVTICDFCQCVVARADKSVEDHGRVADLALTVSVLFRGATGKIRGKNFEVTGRVQYQHPAGGVWDEWYLLFSNGRWGWLAEAEGRYYLTFEKKLTSTAELPPFDTLEPAQKIKLGPSTQMTVVEVGTAEAKAAEGEIPWAFRVGAPHQFADLQGSDGKFGSIEYSDEQPRLFLGTEVTLDDLHVANEEWRAAMGDGTADARVEALSVNCPNCAGALTLHAPDDTLRVSCPSCSSLLDCNDGKLEYLKTLKTRRIKPAIPLGQTGTLDGVDYTVIGFVERFARYQGRDYPWTEYLLKRSKGGYRWLVRSKKHWSFAEPISPSDVHESARSADFKGQSFRVFDRGEATVRHVLGEFYWKVEVGEKAQTSDYIAPPQMISLEFSGTEKSKEINATLATYKSPEEIESAFHIKELARGWSVSPVQPSPRVGDVLKLWLGFLGILLLLKILFSQVLTAGSDTGLFILSLVLASIVPIGVLVHKYSFEVSRWKDSDYSPYQTD